MDRLEQIRKPLHQFIDIYLDEMVRLKNEKVISVAHQQQLEKLSQWDLPDHPQDIGKVMKEMHDDIYAFSTRLGHPRYLGFVPGPACLESWVGDIMTNAYNLHGASWNSTSAASFIESRLIRFLGGKAGFPEKECGGIFVSGGSMANLTAVVTARKQLVEDEDITKAVAYISDEGHSSLKKALMIAGISAKNTRYVPTLADDTMDTETAVSMIEEDIQKGLRPFLIIGSAGTTNRGAVDDLKKIGDIARRYGLWMHVDGAYGATLLLSDHRDLLKGIDRADSISWDGHKWLYQTYGCGIILVKDKHTLLHTYNVHPDYLRDLEDDPHEINYMDHGIELTRPARALKLWLTLQTIGLEKIRQQIGYSIHLAEYFETKVTGYKDWEVTSPASLAIIRFRYVPKGYSLHKINEINEQISKKALDLNYAGIFTSKIKEKVVLRVCMINPYTTYEDVDNIMNQLQSIADKIYQEEEKC